MKETPSKTRNARGLHNDFSEQELTMTNGAMPPAFALSASAAGDNRGNARVNDQKQGKPTIHVEGVPEELVLLLEKWEGIVYESYPDNGEVSAGMGHLLATKEEKDKYPVGTPVPKSVVEQWARTDIGNVWRAAQDQAAELGVESHDFKIALANMSYQNGIYWYKDHHNTWGLMKEHKWEEAAVEAANSKWYSQTQERAEEFQAALRKLAGGQSVRIAEPFRKKAAEAKELAARRKQTPKAATPAHAAKAINEAVPQGKEGMKQIQAKLKEMHLYDGPIDGEQKSKKGESETTKGIKEFQRSQHLPVTGTVDETTWAMMNGKKDDRLLFEKFMVKLNQEQKVNEASKTVGLSTPFTKLAAEAKEKAAAEAKEKAAEQKSPDGDVKGSGNFMADSNFISQLSNSPYVSKNNPGGVQCRKVASEMLLKYLSIEKPEMLEELGFESFIKDNKSVDDLGVKGNFLRILEEDKSHRQDSKLEEDDHFSPPEWIIDHEQAEASITYIDSYLQRNIPVLVGVDHTYNRVLGSKKMGTKSKASRTGNGYNEGTTDHFITLSGIGKDEQGRKYYTFFDPGRTYLDQGSASNVKNRLVHEGGTRFTAKNTGSNNEENYHLAMVVVFPADRAKFAAERTKNNASWID